MTFNQYRREIENATRGQQLHNIIIDMCDSEEIDESQYNELLFAAMKKMEGITTKEEQKNFMVDALIRLMASCQ